MAATVLTSADAGAPDLTGQAGALYNVLKWALPQLGWTIEFDDDVNFKIAFRNDNVEGSGSYLRINNNSANHPAADNRFAQVQMYASMSDVDTGTAITPQDGVGYWLTSSSTDATARPWKIIGNDKFFYFSADMNGDAVRGFLGWAGDVVPEYAATAPAVLYTATGTATTSAVTALNVNGYLSVNSGFDLVLELDGATSGDGVAAFGATRSSNTTGTPGTVATGAYVNPITGESDFIHARCASVNNVLGRLPGGYWPMGDWVSNHSHDETIVGAVTPEGTRDLTFFRVVVGPASTGTRHGILVDPSSGDW